MAKSPRLGNDQLGRLLQQRREALNMSRRDLVDLTELSYPYVSQLETGYRMPSAAAAKRLAKALNLSLDEIFDATAPATRKTQSSVTGADTEGERTSLEIVREIVDLIEALPPETRLQALSEVQTRLMQNLVNASIRRNEAGRSTAS